MSGPRRKNGHIAGALSPNICADVLLCLHHRLSDNRFSSLARGKQPLHSLSRLWKQWLLNCYLCFRSSISITPTRSHFKVVLQRTIQMQVSMRRIKPTTAVSPSFRLLRGLDTIIPYNVSLGPYDADHTELLSAFMLNCYQQTCCPTVNNMVKSSFWYQFSLLWHFFDSSYR